MKEISRCTGHCCEKFTLPYSPAELRLIHNGKGVAELISGKVNFDWKDLQQIVLMVKSISKEWTPSMPNLYSCRNFDAATRNCLIYDRRPRMCRNFPYGRKCPHKDCTLKYDKPIREHLAHKELEWNIGNE